MTKSPIKSHFGITLIELILIIALLGIFISIGYRIYENKNTTLTLDKHQLNILTIKNALKFYKLDNGFYPTTAQGIKALVTKPTTQPLPKHWIQYLKTIPVDINLQSLLPAGESARRAN